MLSACSHRSYYLCVACIHVVIFISNVCQHIDHCVSVNVWCCVGSGGVCAFSDWAVVWNWSHHVLHLWTSIPSSCWRWTALGRWYHFCDGCEIWTAAPKTVGIRNYAEIYPSWTKYLLQHVQHLCTLHNLLISDIFKTKTIVYIHFVLCLSPVSYTHLTLPTILRV